MSRYVFDDVDEGLVYIEVEQDFTFTGSQDLMMHVFFNLLKNALFHIKKAQKGAITIIVKKNQVTFRDTGPGTPKESLPNILLAFTHSARGGLALGWRLPSW